MSILNIIKLRLGLGPAAENHHWDGSVPNQLSLKKGTPEAPGATVIAIGSDLSVAIPGNLSAFMAQWLDVSSVNGRLKLQVPETFDPTNSYVTGRFTPKVPGLYLVSASAQYQAPTVFYVALEIQKNGVSAGVNAGGDYLTTFGAAAVSVLVSLNGTTDYIEIWQDISVTGLPTANRINTSAILIARELP